MKKVLLSLVFLVGIVGTSFAGGLKFCASFAELVKESYDFGYQGVNCKVFIEKSFEDATQGNITNLKGLLLQACKLGHIDRARGWYSGNQIWALTLNKCLQK